MERQIIGENGASYTLGADGPVELFVEQMKAGEGIGEGLMTADQMRWVKLMNDVKSAAEKIWPKNLYMCNNNA